MEYTITKDNPTEDEVAAALAAVSAYMSVEQQPTEQKPEHWRWQASGILNSQKICIVRLPHPPVWNNVERLRRAGPGETGITGM